MAGGGGREVSLYNSGHVIKADRRNIEIGEYTTRCTSDVSRDAIISRARDRFETAADREENAERLERDCRPFRGLVAKSRVYRRATVAILEALTLST